MDRKVVIERDDGDTLSFKFHSVQLAEAALQAIELASRNRDITLREFHLLWQRYHAMIRMKPRTQRVYERLAEPLLQAFGDFRLSELTPETFIVYLRQRLAVGEYAGLLGSLRTLSAILGVAHKWTFLDKNPVSIAALLLASLTDDDSVLDDPPAEPDSEA